MVVVVIVMLEFTFGVHVRFLFSSLVKKKKRGGLVLYYSVKDRSTFGHRPHRAAALVHTGTQPNQKHVHGTCRVLTVGTPPVNC